MKEISDEYSLSHLSSQLMANGFTSRPLDLMELFANPETAVSKSSEDYPKYKEKLKKQSRARDQLVKCMWNMLSSRITERDALNQATTRVGIVDYELERLQGMIETHEDEALSARKEAEGERAKASAILMELDAERERHKTTKENLAKAKNALAFTKSQASHETKRRDTEFAALQTKLSRANNNLGQSKGLTLNPQIFTNVQLPNGSHSSHLLRTTRALNSRNPDSSETISLQEHAMEVKFLEESLALCEQDRRVASEEHVKLFSILETVEGWVSDMSSGLGLNSTVRIEKSHLHVQPTEIFKTSIQPMMSSIQSYIAEKEANQGVELDQLKIEFDLALQKERDAREKAESKEDKLSKDLETALEGMKKADDQYEYIKNKHHAARSSKKAKENARKEERVKAPEKIVEEPAETRKLESLRAKAKNVERKSSLTEQADKAMQEVRQELNQFEQDRQRSVSIFSQPKVGPSTNFCEQDVPSPFKKSGLYQEIAVDLNPSTKSRKRKGLDELMLGVLSPQNEAEKKIDVISEEKRTVKRPRSGDNPRVNQKENSRPAKSLTFGKKM